MKVDDVDMYKRFFMKTLTSESLYDLIDIQFKNNNLFVITERDIQKQLMDIITENPDVGDIIRDNGLDIKLPPGPPPPGAAPPGAAPPGAAPPGAAPPRAAAPGAAPPGAAPAAAAAASYLSGLYGRLVPGAAPAAAAAAAAPPDAAMSLLPTWASTRPPPAPAPQGAQPGATPADVVMQQAREDMQQGTTQFGRFGVPQQVLDITMEDASEPIEDRAKELTIRLYDHIINIARGLPLDTLINFQEFYEDNDLNVGIKDVHGYIDRDDVYGDIKGTPLLEAIKKLVDGRFITKLRKDLKTLVSTQQGSTSSSSQAIALQPQRTRAAATYVSPPKPILPQAITDTPQQAQKRNVEQIEGIEEREESPKSKAKAKSITTKAKSATTKPAADDPRTLSVDEQANVLTVLNQFRKHEEKRIREENNIDTTQKYLTDTISTVSYTHLTLPTKA